MTAGPWHYWSACTAFRHRCPCSWSWLGWSNINQGHSLLLTGSMIGVFGSAYPPHLKQGGCLIILSMTRGLQELACSCRSRRSNHFCSRFSCGAPFDRRTRKPSSWPDQAILAGEQPMDLRSSQLCLLIDLEYTCSLNFSDGGPKASSEANSKYVLVSGPPPYLPISLFFNWSRSTFLAPLDSFWGLSAPSDFEICWRWAAYWWDPRPFGHGFWRGRTN